MPKSDDSNILLSSLEEIKKGSEDETLPKDSSPPPTPASPEQPPSASRQPASLLGSLLDEVKKEADREIEEITRTLEEKSAEVKRQEKAEEQQKKEQYDKLIQEEAGRRMAMIQRKEDEKTRKEADARFAEQEGRERAALLVKQKQRKKGLTIAAAIAGTAVVAAGVLVATGVIPLLEEAAVAPQEETAPAANDERPAEPVEKPEEKPKGPPIGEPGVLAAMGIDGPAAAVLALPEKKNLETYEKLFSPRPEVEDRIEIALMRQRVVKAFARRGGGSSGGSSGSSGSSGDITIDTSVFDEKKK